MFKTREEKWQQRWRDEKCFVPKNDGTKPKHYTLFEFPFPNAKGLHVGHLLPYTSMDIMARWRRMLGFDVLFPMGYDSMGIAIERYAVQVGKNPADAVAELIEIFNSDFNMAGISYDPESVISTSDPKFIKWTQWMFIQLFKAGLAYKSELPMNWCDACKTCFTNEELEDGNCERCKGPIEQKMKLQWNLAITKYADRLVDDLSLVDYTDRVRHAQEQWVGRSYGADIDFKVGDDLMTVYTTRIDTIYGATFAVIAPEHKLVAKWLSENKIENADEIHEYIKAAARKSEIERTDTKNKSGVRLAGIMAYNPFTRSEIPVFISDYVLADYGHGAIMAVPAHDQRDFEFATKFDLPIIPVLDNGFDGTCATEGDGLHINSDFMNELNKEDAINAAIGVGDAGGYARATKQYKMRDWGFSRQMYWGECIPLVHCDCCGWAPIPDSELPLIQPHMDDYRPTADGESPLARLTDWINTKCPACGGDAKRETDTMPGWAGSSWYFLRFLDPQNNDEFCARDKMDKWMPVNHYNGPMEHVTRHMMYSRFWYKALYDLGLVPGVEPYAKRTLNGLVMGSDGRKMSKSLGNLVPASDAISRAGGDAVRLCINFLAPFEANRDWSEDTLRGCEKFLRRVENFSDNLGGDTDEFLMNDLIKKMSERIEGMQFNTAIAAMMEYINHFAGQMPRKNYETLIKVLNPFAPHLAEEMWEKLGHTEMLVFEPWPVADESKLVKQSVSVSVSVNGKFRGAVEVATDADENSVKEIAMPVAQKYLVGDIVKIIFVKNKMINFVTKG